MKYICDCGKKYDIIAVHTVVKTRYETKLEYLLYCNNCKKEIVKTKVIKT